MSNILATEEIAKDAVENSKKLIERVENYLNERIKYRSPEYGETSKMHRIPELLSSIDTVKNMNNKDRRYLFENYKSISKTNRLSRENAFGYTMPISKGGDCIPEKCYSGENLARKNVSRKNESKLTHHLQTVISIQPGSKNHLHSLRHLDRTDIFPNNFHIDNETTNYSAVGSLECQLSDPTNKKPFSNSRWIESSPRRFSKESHRNFIEVNNDNTCESCENNFRQSHNGSHDTHKRAQSSVPQRSNELSSASDSNKSSNYAESRSVTQRRSVMAGNNRDAAKEALLRRLTYNPEISKQSPKNFRGVPEESNQVVRLENSKSLFQQRTYGRYPEPCTKSKSQLHRSVSANKSRSPTGKSVSALRIENNVLSLHRILEDHVNSEKCTTVTDSDKIRRPPNGIWKTESLVGRMQRSKGNSERKRNTSILRAKSEARYQDDENDDMGQVSLDRVFNDFSMQSINTKMDRLAAHVVKLRKRVEKDYADFDSCSPGDDIFGDEEVGAIKSGIPTGMDPGIANTLKNIRIMEANIQDLFDLLYPNEVEIWSPRNNFDLS